MNEEEARPRTPWTVWAIALAGALAAGNAAGGVFNGDYGQAVMGGLLAVGCVGIAWMIRRYPR